MRFTRINLGRGIKNIINRITRGRAWLKPASGPLAFVVLVITNRCNLKCITCLRGGSSSEDLNLNLLDGLFTEVRKIGFNAISLTGGEPILHPEFKEILKKISAHGMKFGLVTNGVRYKDYLEALAPHAQLVNFIAVSLDSHIKEINDAIRGTGTYERALEAVYSFKKAGYFTKISHVVNKKNAGELGNFVRFVNGSIKPDAINIMGVIKTGENEDLVLGAEERAKFHKELGDLLRTNRNLHVCTSTGYYRAPFYCSHFVSLDELTVNCKGDFVFCCDNTFKGAVLGNLKEKPFEEILRKFLQFQLELKYEAIKDKLNLKNESTHDCNYCNKILEQLTTPK